ncbi:hypothetical protein DPMN_116337 [Dreissena polymorpha]|uniref:Uncharacterized protein n=1 Tax=Dreissena polymorpha TaxID=45954 RepID=A0A9D4QTV3_DREPO|nr:hypothetical protein DPMN_116337 [Dreissena polymorpha]
MSEAMVALNEDMHDIRERIKQDNKQLYGLKDETKVNVEGDTCNNNPLFNSGHTSFQGVTNAVTTMCENTRTKRIIGVHVANKLFMVYSRLLTEELQWIVPIMTMYGKRVRD